MSGWWGWASCIAPRAAQNRDLPASEVESEPECQPRLTGPRGRVVWIVQTASGGKSDWDTEHEALERAKESAGACVYPVLIEDLETA